MKKIILIVTLAFIVAFCVSGCSFNKADKSLQNVIDEGTLRVGVKDSVKGFGYYNEEKDEYEGLEVDIAKLIAKEMGDLEVKFVPVISSTRGRLLNNDDIDIVAATFTVTDERKLSYNFSTPYYTDYVSVMVNRNSGINTVNDLAGKTIGVALGADSDECFQATYGDIVSVNFKEFGNYPEIKNQLQENEIDAFCTDRCLLNGYYDDKVKILDEKFSPQSYGVATKLENRALSSYIDNLVNKWLEDGTINKLIEKNNIK